MICSSIIVIWKINIIYNSFINNITNKIFLSTFSGAHLSLEVKATKNMRIYCIMKWNDDKGVTKVLLFLNIIYYGIFFYFLKFLLKFYPSVIEYILRSQMTCENVSLPPFTISYINLMGW